MQRIAALLQRAVWLLAVDRPYTASALVAKKGLAVKMQCAVWLLASVLLMSTSLSTCHAAAAATNPTASTDPRLAPSRDPGVIDTVKQIEQDLGDAILPNMNTEFAIDPEFFRLLQGSYERLVGSPLVPPENGASWLYHQAPFAVLAHNTDPDPRFIYANWTAQLCFEYSWDEITRLRSRFSAEVPNQAERQYVLDTVARDGFVSDYRGLRIARSGRRFWIEQGTVWQLVDEDGVRRGQAALFRSWRDA
jgi:hypothetical protein